ncbi:MAG: hypothetical protein OCD76_13370 [Reichenbachiella sp.]
MKSSKQVEELRAKLKSKENRLWSQLDHETVDLEHRLTILLKGAGIVGASVLAGYLVYRLVAGESSHSNTKKIKKTGPGLSSKLSQSIMSMFIKSIIPFAIEKIQTQVQSTKTNESTSENRRG